MKMKVTITGIEIVPESDVDIIYIEMFLNLKKDGDSITCVRRNVLGESWIAYLEIEP